ncbi:MAG: DUF411 domain-containing protein [Pseudomonadota bacterium]
MKTACKANQQRRQLLKTLIYSAAAVPLIGPSQAMARELSATVWKDPSCGCCDDWITYLEDNGFTVTAYNEGAVQAMKRLGMPFSYGSCHTAEIGGYAIEGHVPVREILRLLDEQPDAAGLSVPAMPRGTPGMDGPLYGGIVDPYDVLLISREGEATVYQSYR